MEIELKLLLEAGEADRLRAHLGAPRMIEHQSNRYFDDDAHSLARAGWGLRVRESSGPGQPVHWTLTLKHAGEVSGEFSLRPEYEVALESGRVDPMAIARSLLTDPSVLPEVAVREVGRMENRREVHRLPGTDLAVELDRTIWPDGSVSEELEVEIDDPHRSEEVRRVLLELLELLQIPWRVGQESKLARLMRML